MRLRCCLNNLIVIEINSSQQVHMFFMSYSRPTRLSRMAYTATPCSSSTPVDGLLILFVRPTDTHSARLGFLQRLPLPHRHEIPRIARYTFPLIFLIFTTPTWKPRLKMHGFFPPVVLFLIIHPLPIRSSRSPAPAPTPCLAEPARITAFTCGIPGNSKSAPGSGTVV